MNKREKRVSPHAGEFENDPADATSLGRGAAGEERGKCLHDEELAHAVGGAVVTGPGGGQDDETYYTCSKCGKKFESYFIYDRHVKNCAG